MLMGAASALDTAFAVEVAADVAAELTEGTTAGGLGFGPLARALEKERQSSSAASVLMQVLYFTVAFSVRSFRLSSADILTGRFRLRSVMEGGPERRMST